MYEKMKPTVNEKVMSEMTDAEKLRQKQNSLTILPIQVSVLFRPVHG